MLRRQLTVLSLLLAAGAGLAACAQIRSVTYPAQVRYIDRQEIESTMYAMAVQLHQLDELVAGAASAPAVQPRVVGVLGEINRLASTLGEEGQSTNHPALDAQLDGFLTQVSRARLQAQQEPPNYYEAGRLSGSCSACHQLRLRD
ncbi:hypothetical protein Q4485_02100 [Granulosicoccaceae sp. 1_MG-2023]|nr:hypothetical protein [Granulosicoccaceae sp. 1_MG-2023]